MVAALGAVTSLASHNILSLGGGGFIINAGRREEIVRLHKARQVLEPSSDGKVGKDRTMPDEKRRVTIGYVDDNNQSVEMKVPLDGFEIDEAGVDVVIFLNADAEMIVWSLALVPISP